VKGCFTVILKPLGSLSSILITKLLITIMLTDQDTDSKRFCARHYCWYDGKGKDCSQWPWKAAESACHGTTFQCLHLSQLWSLVPISSWADRENFWKILLSASGAYALTTQLRCLGPVDSLGIYILYIQDYIVKSAMATMPCPGLAVSLCTISFGDWLWPSLANRHSMIW